MGFDVIAFDADDTLWHTEALYTSVQDWFKHLLARYHPPEWIEHKLFETEMRNLSYFGYGIKGFTLSMIETAIELTEGRVTGSEIQAVIDRAKGMVQAEVELLDGVAETMPRLAERCPLMIITKGDLLDQEAKIARSGLGSYFTHVEIVSEKTRESYAAVLARYHLPPERFMMVGNSLRSDVLPVVALGGHAVHIPHPLTWAHEQVDPAALEGVAYHRLENIRQLPQLLEELDTAADDPVISDQSSVISY
jgi:putative hydrolase of the HAD superfamily